jgi:hypothetical protein
MLLELFRNAPAPIFAPCGNLRSNLGLQTIPFRPDTTVHTRGIGPGGTFGLRAYTPLRHPRRTVSPNPTSAEPESRSNCKTGCFVTHSVTARCHPGSARSSLIQGLSSLVLLRRVMHSFTLHHARSVPGLHQSHGPRGGLFKEVDESRDHAGAREHEAELLDLVALRGSPCRWTMPLFSRITGIRLGRAAVLEVEPALFATRPG